MDVHVRHAITEGLRTREVDVLTAQEDGTATLEDDQLLDRAGKLRRVIFTHDEDFLSEAVRRMDQGIPFTGVIYIHQMKVSVGRCIEDLEFIAKAGEPEDFENRIEYLPYTR
jgi:predicted nuclease of predicted toxin-antitoxin system